MATASLKVFRAAMAATPGHKLQPTLGARPYIYQVL